MQLSELTSMHLQPPPLWLFSQTEKGTPFIDLPSTEETGMLSAVKQWLNPQPNLNSEFVIDLGMHTGEDTEYYLNRGFRVVAVEANPHLAQETSSRLQKHIDSGQLTVLNVALSDRDDETAVFYISNINSEWSSFDRYKEEPTSQEISVPTTTLGALIKRFGVPYYIKSDIEGADRFFCEQLLYLKEQPRFVSVEASDIEWIALLSAAGYDQFQIVNQAEIRRMTPTISFRLANKQKQWTFGSHSSGPFGADLNRNKWLSFKAVAQLWLDFDRLKCTDPSMVLDNWFDVHATRGDVLASTRR